MSDSGAAPLVATDGMLGRGAEAAQAPAVAVARVESMAFRFPLKVPVVTSFGAMVDRPAVIVRVEDAEGAVGWGEVWCNFPRVGAEHRARLVETELAPRVLGAAPESPAATFRRLERALRVLALQTGEWGPLAQCLAGLDIALWDLAARRAGLPLAALLGGAPAQAAPVYASGINLAGAEATVERMRGEGFSAFKVKVGFGLERDLAALEAIARGLRPGDRLMADANQAWDIGAARAFARGAAELPLDWLEEPLPADRPLAEWRSLAEDCPMALAAGENLRGSEAFDAAISAGVFGVLQPDVCKWGGLTGCQPVARAILRGGRRYCPHFLGAGVGLVASAHLLAAAGGDGMLEVDVNPNPLRELLAQPFPAILRGTMTLPGGAGLGVEPDLEAAAAWRVI